MDVGVQSRSSALSAPVAVWFVALAVFVSLAIPVCPEVWNFLAFTREGYFLSVNTYSFATPDYPWVHREWLSLFLLNRWFGAFGGEGLRVLRMLAVLAATAIVAMGLFRQVRSGFWKVVTLTLFLLVVSGSGITAGPSLFSWLLCAILISILSRTHAPLSLPVWMFLLGGVWANLDGRFAVGQALLVLTLIGASVSYVLHPDRRGLQDMLTLASAVFAFLLGTLTHPDGGRNWGLALRTVMGCRQMISGGILTGVCVSGYLAFCLLGAIALAGVLAAPRVHARAWIMLPAAMLSGFICRELLPMSAVVILVSCRDGIAALPRRFATGSIRHQGRNVFRILLLTASLALLLFSALRIGADGFSIWVPATRYPNGAITFLDHNGISGNALVYHEWTGPVMTRLYPGIRCLVDSRMESAYPESLIRLYREFMDGRVRRALDIESLSLVVIPTGSRSDLAMKQEPDWMAVYTDRTATVYVHRQRQGEIIRMNAMGILYRPPHRDMVFP